MKITPRKHPWLNPAADFAKLNDSFVALDPHRNPGSWTAWRDYFRWLNWAPACFIEVERLHDANSDSPSRWTAPTDHPDKLTGRFAPAKGLAPIFPLLQTKTLRDEAPAISVAEMLAKAAARPLDGPRGRLANLFVGRDKPGFQAMVARAEKSDPAYWCWYENDPKWGSGIKVPLNWYRELTGADKKPWFERLTTVDAERILADYAHAAQDFVPPPVESVPF